MDPCVNTYISANITIDPAIKLEKLNQAEYYGSEESDTLRQDGVKKMNNYKLKYKNLISRQISIFGEDLNGKSRFLTR